jgi:hypothetical protein
MRAFLFSLLAAVAAILLWAIRSESYQNGLVFTLSTLAAGLCGYLLADYFFNIEKKTLKEDVVSVGQEIQALKDEKDLLQTQFNLATPHAQVEQLEQQLSFADEQRNKLDGLTRAQYAEISGLKTQLEMQKKNYQKLFEESAIATETRNSEIASLQDTLASKREKIKYLTDEGDYLRGKIQKLQAAAEEGTIQKVVSEINQPPAPNLPKMVIQLPKNGVHTEGVPLQMMDPRAIKFNTIDVESSVETRDIDAQPVADSPITEAHSAPTSSEPSAILNGKMTEAAAAAVEKKNDNLSKLADTQAVAMSKSITAHANNGQVAAVDDTQAVAMSKSIAAHANSGQRGIEETPMATLTSDNTHLQAIQGVSADMERVLKSAGIDNWHELSETTPQRLKEILSEGKIRNVDVSHWSVQAILLTDGHLNRLKTYLENLNK